MNSFRCSFVFALATKNKSFLIEIKFPIRDPDDLRGWGHWSISFLVSFIIFQKIWDLWEYCSGRRVQNWFHKKRFCKRCFDILYLVVVNAILFVIFTPAWRTTIWFLANLVLISNLKGGRPNNLGGAHRNGSALRASEKLFRPQVLGVHAGTRAVGSRVDFMALPGRDYIFPYILLALTCSTHAQAYRRGC